MTQSVVFNWSGGKDSALARYKTLQSGYCAVQTLFTTISEHYQHISMRGVRNGPARPLDPRPWAALPQAAAAQNSHHGRLRTADGQHHAGTKKRGSHGFHLRRYFLKDQRQYRENKLAELGLEAVFPLWGVSMAELIREFIGVVGGFGRHRRVIAGNERKVAKAGRRLLPFGIEGGQLLGG